MSMQVIADELMALKSQLDKTVNDHKREITLLTEEFRNKEVITETKYSKLQRAFEKQKKVCLELKKENDEMKGQLATHANEMKEEIDALKTKLDTKIMFFATCTTTQTLHDKETLIFDNLITNENDGYDLTSGVFTAPQNGFYQFNLAIQAQDNYEADVYLRHNKANVIYLSASTSSGNASASNSCVIR